MSKKYVLLAFTVASFCILEYWISVQKPSEVRVYPLPAVKTKVWTTVKSQFPTESPFFGLAYQDIYGCAINKTDDFKSPTKDWKDYFPRLLSSLQQFQQRNPDNNVELNTHVNSKLVIVGGRREYSVGEEVEATIVAFDQRGEKILFGGDVFLARLVYSNTSLYPDGVPGVVTDNGNGTYGVRVPLLMPGEAVLEVKLSMPLAGIAEMIRCTSVRVFLGTQYVATLESEEKVECNVDMSIKRYKREELCDYSNPRNEEPWFCVKPPSGKCSKIADIIFNRQPSSMGITTQPCDDALHLKMSLNKTINGSGVKFHVKPGVSSTSAKLPPCLTNLTSSETDRPNGYMVNGRWRSRFCNATLESMVEAKPCFVNKIIYFLGDSTIRQFYYLSLSQFGLTSNGPPNGRVWQQPLTATDSSGRIRLYYRAHGPPLQNPGPPKSRPYMSDVIDEIEPGEAEVIIVLNIGLHILYYDPSVFIHRLSGIRDSLIRLVQRRANTRIIYRSHRVTSTINSWLIYRLGVITRELFNGVENFFYLDLWDLSTLWSLDDFHPKVPHLEVEALYLFNFICNGIR